jgi:hypothetical protein
MSETEEPKCTGQIIVSVYDDDTFELSAHGLLSELQFNLLTDLATRAYWRYAEKQNMPSTQTAEERPTTD